MLDLVTEFALLSFVSAIFGFVLGSWWSLRRFRDDHKPDEKTGAPVIRPDDSNWRTLWHRLDAISQAKNVNLQPVLGRIDSVMYAISRLDRPVKCDLSGVERRLESLSSAVADIPIPLTPIDVDLQPVLEKLDLIKQDFKRRDQ